MRWQVITLLLIIAIAPAVSAVSADIDPSNYSYCYDQEFFFRNDTSDISGYMKLSHFPQLANQISISTPVSSTTGDKILGTWATEPLSTTEIKTLAPGTWRFTIYAHASSDAGISSLKFYAINRSQSGIETSLFFGNAITGDIPQGTVPSKYELNYARRNSTNFFPGDRMVIRVNASTDNPNIRIITLDTAGNTNASFVQISYFPCEQTTKQQVVYLSSGSAVAGEQIPLNPLVPVIALAVLAIGLRVRK